MNVHHGKYIYRKHFLSWKVIVLVSNKLERVKILQSVPQKEEIDQNDDRSCFQTRQKNSSLSNNSKKNVFAFIFYKNVKIKPKNAIQYRNHWLWFDFGLLLTTHSQYILKPPKQMRQYWIMIIHMDYIVSLWHNYDNWTVKSSGNHKFLEPFKPPNIDPMGVISISYYANEPWVTTLVLWIFPWHYCNNWVYYCNFPPAILLNFWGHLSPPI